MDLIELTKKCAEAIPDFPQETVNTLSGRETEEVVSFRYPSSSGKNVTFKYLVNDAVHEACARWRVSLKDPAQGFAFCHFNANNQEWAFRLYEQETKIYVFSVGLPATGHPHGLFTCYYDMSTRNGACSLCGEYGILKFGEYGGMMVPHVARCASCQPLPCGEPTIPFKR